MNSLHEQILQDLKDRSDWEKKAAVSYKLRNGGIPRGRLPYPNGPDLRFPLIDSSIGKDKPFYAQQLYATDTVASFVAKKFQQAELTTAVAAWFDYKVKQESNFEREAICAIDTLLQDGGCPVKIFWNTRKKRLEFDACDRLHVIVPKATEELHDADRLTHVLHLSESQYRRNPLYRKDEDFIKKIKGKGGGHQTGDDNYKLQEVARREGLTCGQNDDQIVLWEIYTRNETNDEITVKTRSPLAFDEEVRPDFLLPYSEGVFKEGWFPFVNWRREIKEKGYYSSRGKAETLAPFQQILCKNWNYIAEHMDYFARPTFRHDPQAQSPIGSTSNIDTSPGAILPPGLIPNNPPQLPSSLYQDMQMTREMAEYLEQSPDFGIMNQQGGKRTATEISAIAGQSGQGSDLRARIFRLDLGDTYRMAWALLLQYGKETLSYVLDNEAAEVPQEAIHDCYEVAPNGSADSWNRGAQFAKAMERFKLLQNNPYIRQDQLTKDLLASDEPGKIKALFQEPQHAQASEMEEQNMELLLMDKRFAAIVDPADDDKAHLQAIAQWFPTRVQEGPLDPITAKLVFEHIQGHGQQLAQKKDPMLKQIDMAMKPISAALIQIAQPPQSNVLPGPGAQGPMITDPLMEQQ